MPFGARNLEWLAHNAVRAYPLVADVSRQAVNGSVTFELPDDFIVSLYFPVDWGLTVEPGKFFIKRVAVYPTGYSITLGYAATGGDIDVASASIARSSHTPNQVYNIGGMGDFAGSRGFVVLGDLTNINKQPPGQWDFDLDTARLEPDVIRPNIQAVQSIQVQNGSELSEPLYGHIRLQAGRNQRITPVIISGQDPRLIFEAIEGAGLTEQCECEDTSVAITQINGVAPDETGNFILQGDSCLTITAIGNGLQLADECSAPCCGCEELKAVTAALEAFGDKATTLENFLVNLESRVTQMDQVVLGSRLNDRGCG